MCALTAVAYGASLSGWWVYEDAIVPDRTELVRGLVRWSRDAVTWVAGDSPTPQRVLNLTWHLLNGMLLYLVARAAVGAWAAVFAAAVFLLHPLQTETVAYVASRPELIMATWLLLAMAASARGWMAVAGLCAALALTGKEVAVMAWILVPLWAWQTDQQWSRRHLAAWSLAGAVMIALFGVALHGAHWLTLPSLAYVAGQLAHAGRLVLLLGEALISPPALTIDHDWTWVTRTAAFTALGLWALAVTWCGGWVRWALVWTLVALLPRLVLPMPDGIHERHLYIPMIGLSLAIGAALFPRGSDAH